MIASLDTSLFSCFRRAGDLGRRLMELGETVRLPGLTRKEEAATGEKNAAARDQLELSEALRQLQATGIDLNRSGVVQSDTQFNFNFQFQNEQVRMLTSNGYFDAQSQSMKMDLSFRSALTVVDPETGEERQELFELNFRMELSNTSIQLGETHAEKEDILEFARKILDKIQKISTEGKQLDGLELSQDDLRDLGGVEDGRLLHSILNLIQLIKTSDQLQHKSGPYAAAHSERPQTRHTDSSSQESFQAEYSLSVARVSQKLVYQEIDEPSEAA
ncbi:MAG: hypothetical protein AB9873_20630 [Syntrophobacteraceae bacterium]